MMEKTKKELCQLCREEITGEKKAEFTLTNGVICTISRSDHEKDLWFFDFKINAVTIYLITKCRCPVCAADALLTQRSFKMLPPVIWVFNSKVYQPNESGAEILAEAVQKGQTPELAILTH